MKNIVFDLGGVVFARDPQKCTAEFTDFFSFVGWEEMPHFWSEYDRGTLSMEQVKDALCEYHGCTREVTEHHMATAIGMQEEIAPTAALIADLKRAGYRLYVLSNMSREFIDFLRRKSVYRHFDGEVVSCDEHVIKPERAIYETLLSRYSLVPAETLFIDDRRSNVEAAAGLGIATLHFDRTNPAASCEVLRQMLL